MNLNFFLVSKRHPSSLVSEFWILSWIHQDTSIYKIYFCCRHVVHYKAWSSTNCPSYCISRLVSGSCTVLAQNPRQWTTPCFCWLSCTVHLCQINATPLSHFKVLLCVDCCRNSQKSIIVMCDIMSHGWFSNLEVVLPK